MSNTNPVTTHYQYTIQPDAEVDKAVLCDNTPSVQKSVKEIKDKAELKKWQNDLKTREEDHTVKSRDLAKALSIIHKQEARIF